MPPVKKVAVDVIGPAPEQARPGDAGFDLRARFEDQRGVVIRPGEWIAIKCEPHRIALPENVAGMILPRSGLALKKGLTVLNTPGLIDPGYRGELSVTLYHAGRIGGSVHGPVHIRPGDRIAQLVFVPFVVPTFREMENLDVTERGEGGYGSTGVE